MSAACTGFPHPFSSSAGTTTSGTSVSPQTGPGSDWARTVLRRKALLCLPSTLGKVIFKPKIFFHIVFIMRKSKATSSERELKDCYIDVSARAPNCTLSESCFPPDIFQGRISSVIFMCLCPLPHHLYSWSFVKNDSIKPPMVLARRGV